MPKYLLYWTTSVFQLSLLGPQIGALRANLVSFLLIDEFWGCGNNPAHGPANPGMGKPVPDGICAVVGVVHWDSWVFSERRESQSSAALSRVKYSSFLRQDKSSLHFLSQALSLNPIHSLSLTPPWGPFTFIYFIFLDFNLFTSSFPGHLNMK